MLHILPMVEKIYEYVKDKYNTDPEFLWKKSPDCCIFRCAKNKKWYGIIMTVKKEKLGLKGEGSMYILNTKIDDPIYLNFLLKKEGFFKAYHMNKNNWATTVLDGTVPLEDILKLIDLSYLVVSENRKNFKNAKNC